MPVDPNNNNKLKMGPMNVPLVNSIHEIPVVEGKKRKHPAVIAAQIIAFVSWLLIALGMVFITIAQPSQVTFIERYLRIDVSRMSSNKIYLFYALAVVLVNLALCAVGFVFNFMLYKQKKDKLRLSLIIPGSISLMFVVTVIVMII